VIDTQVVDNFLPKQVADEIYTMLFSGDFPWFFKEDVTYDSYDETRTKNSPGFSHVFFNLQNGPSSFYFYVNTLPFIGKVQLPPSQIIKARTFLQLATNTPQKDAHNNKHIDTKEPHIVLLYYVCDSDGDTFLMSKDETSDIVTKRISPKKNRALIFDGSMYHASSKPEHTNRCVINFDLKPFQQ
jgi:hypothetical protein